MIASPSLALASGAMPAELLWLIPGGWGVALLFLWLWWNRLRFARLLADVPAVPVNGIFVGLVETAGVVECDAPLLAGLTRNPCVYHQWSVCEHWERTETYTDSKGKRRTRTVTGSDVVASGGGQVDLRLRDETGAIVVRTRGASWTPATTFSQRARRGDALYASVAPNERVYGSTGVRTFEESAVPIGVRAWIFGNAFIRADSSALEIGGFGEEQVFMISLAGERRHFGWALTMAIVGCSFGCVAAAGAGVGIAAAIQHHAAPLAASVGGGDRLAIIGPALNLTLFLMLVAALWSILVRNGAVRVRNRWLRAASLVDVELKRRADLIPNLVAVTQGLSMHESGVQQAMAQLRAGSTADRALRVLVERYPELRADGAFLKLQGQLTETEDRIAQARRFELQSREALLLRLRTFPAGLIARLMGVATPPPPLASPAPRPSSPSNPPPG